MYISCGAEQILWVLNPSKRPSGDARFPGVLSAGVSLRVAKGECLHQWFKRCVDEGLDGSVKPCQLTPSTAFFGSVIWDSRVLTHCRLQVLHTDSDDLESYYRGKGTERTWYYRLELDPTIPGPLFKEPLPHLHVTPDGEPRIPFGSSGKEMLLAEFLEFILIRGQSKR